MSASGAAVTSLGSGFEADAAGALVISGRGAARRGVGERSRASLASSDSGDEGAGHRPPRKRSRRLSPPAQPAATMHQPCTNGAHLNGTGPPAHNGLAPHAEPDPGPERDPPAMSQVDQEIVRLIGQHLVSVGLQ